MAEPRRNGGDLTRLAGDEFVHHVGPKTADRFRQAVNAINAVARVWPVRSNDDLALADREPTDAFFVGNGVKVFRASRVNVCQAAAAEVPRDALHQFIARGGDSDSLVEKFAEEGVNLHGVVTSQQADDGLRGNAVQLLHLFRRQVGEYPLHAAIALDFEQLAMCFTALDRVWRGFVEWASSHARKPCRRFRRWNEASIMVQEDCPTERLAEQNIE